MDKAWPSGCTERCVLAPVTECDIVVTSSRYGYRECWSFGMNWEVDMILCRRLCARTINSFAAALFLFAFLFSTKVSMAGDTERQLVFQCYYKGASTLAQFEQCTGLTGNINDFRGCLSSNSCFGESPGGAISAVEFGRQCAQQAKGDIAEFARCTRGQVVLPRRDQALIRCAEDNSGRTVMAFATCAAPTAGIKLTDDQRAIIGCAATSGGDEENFKSCLGNSVTEGHLNSKQSGALDCAKQFSGGADSLADCSAEKIFTAGTTPEERIAVRCVVDSGGDSRQFETCVGTSYMNVRLNPEQQIAVECTVGTGGQLYAAAGCIATRLTARELEKCTVAGFGGDGCFGDTNDLVGSKGWTARTLKTLPDGPNSVFNNPAQIWGGSNSMFNNPQQIWGGSNSIFNNPSQIWGGPNSVVRNPSQVFGGQNSTFNNPGQVLSGPTTSIFQQTPPNPVTVGSVGGRKVCVPWCNGGESEAPTNPQTTESKIPILDSAYLPLYNLGEEPSGYGLYSYVIIIGSSDRDLAFVKGVIDSFPSAGGLPWPHQQINLLLLPEQRETDGQCKGKSGTAHAECMQERISELENYDHDSARTFLYRICNRPLDILVDFCRSGFGRGPFLFTYARPVSKLAVIEPPFLFLDLSSVEQAAFEEYLEAFKTQIKSEDITDGSKINTVRLKVLSLILLGSGLLDPVEKAIAEIIHVPVFDIKK
jgi:hypothetical protein